MPSTNPRTGLEFVTMGYDDSCYVDAMEEVELHRDELIAALAVSCGVTVEVAVQHVGDNMCRPARSFDESLAAVCAWYRVWVMNDEVMIMRPNSEDPDGCLMPCAPSAFVREAQNAR